MSLLFVDSGCDLSVDQIKMLGIECVNLPYMINDRELSFVGEFDYEKFYSKCRKGVVIDRSPLSKQEYIDIFEPAIKGDDIIYIHENGKLLDMDILHSVRDFLLKKYDGRRFELIDSKNYSIGYGSISYLLARLYRNGGSIDEIVNASYDISKETAMYVILDGLDGLCNHQLLGDGKVVGTSLNIKPIISIDVDGNVQVVDKVSGRKKAINRLLEIVRQTGENVVDYPMAIVHSHLDSDAIDLDTRLKECFGNDIQLTTHKMSPENVSLFGMHALGVVFHTHCRIH